MTERIVEVMANQLKRTLSAKELLAALEADGYAWYRPDDCGGVTVESCEYDHEGCRFIVGHVPDSPPGAYRLVPVGGEG